MTDGQLNDPWKEDRLGYREIGNSFSNLVQSIHEAKVISIEAGFGRGKTFFRAAWAQELRNKGEVVVEIDAQLSDHSGDPVVTFLGALVSQIPKQEKPTGEQIVEMGQKYGGLAIKTVAKAFARNAAEDVFDTLTDGALDHVAGVEVLEGTLEELGDGMSKFAGKLIASQMAAEQVRKKEIPKQLEALHKALTQSAKTQRVVVLIDELDRCHPEYALDLLEAMKLVFNSENFVFVLFVNDVYLENLAAHRFGKLGKGERYLDKFVDIRLTLPFERNALSQATEFLARSLPLNIPFGEGDEFTVARASHLAGELAPVSGLSIRQIERVLLRVELALRCYRDVPLDLPLLVYLAFREMAGRHQSGFWIISENHFSRARLTPEKAQEFWGKIGDLSDGSQARNAENFVQSNAAALQRPAKILSRTGTMLDWPAWAIVLKEFAPWYIPKHEEVLRSVHSFVTQGPDHP